MKLFYPYKERETEIEWLSLPENKEIKFRTCEHQIWLVTKGALDLRLQNKKTHAVEFGHIIFLPEGMNCQITVTLSTMIFRFRIPDMVGLLEELYPGGLEEERGLYKTPFNPLELTPLLFEYTRHLTVLFEECTFTTLFKESQTYHLLLLLKSCYSRECIAGLFYPVIRTHDPFFHFVWDNYQEAKNARELARLYKRSIRSFERQFKHTFGIPPGQWLLNKKIEMVYYEVMNEEIPLMTIVKKCGFSNLSQLSDFCKKFLGACPTKLRKHKKEVERKGALAL